MRKIIIFEYLTSQSQEKQSFQKRIFKEGLKMSNEISLNIIKSSAKNKVLILRSKYLIEDKILRKKSIKLLKISTKNTWSDLLKKQNKQNTSILLIAPEIDNIYYVIAKKIAKMGFRLLNSDLNSIRIFSSKKLTYEYLLNKKIKCINTQTSVHQIKNKKRSYVIKPEKSAGSENVLIAKTFEDLKNLESIIKKKYVIQIYDKNLVGSIIIICKNGKSNLISCNKHIIEVKNKKIKQIGTIIGGLEKFRSQLDIISKSISQSFHGLFGYVGIDLILTPKSYKVIEINTRFTSSVLGLRNAYGKEIIDYISDFYIKDIFEEDKQIKLLKKVKIIF